MGPLKWGPTVQDSPMPKFSFDSETLALERHSQRRSAGGVSGATYYRVASETRHWEDTCERFLMVVRDPESWSNSRTPRLLDSLWPKALHAVKVTLIPKGDPSSTDPRRWQLVSNWETVAKVTFEILRQHVVRHVGVPLLVLSKGTTQTVQLRRQNATPCFAASASAYDYIKLATDITESSTMAQMKAQELRF